MKGIYEQSLKDTLVNIDYRYKKISSNVSKEERGTFFIWFMMNLTANLIVSVWDRLDCEEGRNQYANDALLLAEKLLDAHKKGIKEVKIENLEDC